MGRRHFAKKGEDVRHFRLVARSGPDDDEEKAPLVLEPIVTPGVMRRTGKTEAELLTVPESLEHLGSAIHRPGEEEEERPQASGSTGPRPRGDSEDYDEWGDLDGDCYFPPDGYDYDQHLRNVSGTKKNKSVVGVVLNAPEPVETEEIMKQSATNDDEAEVLRALEHAEEYDELEDEEMEDVLIGGLTEPDLVLWGPAALETRDMPDLAIFAEHKAMMEAMKRGGMLEDDDDDFDDGLGEFDEGAASGTAKGSRAQATPAKDEDFEKFMENEYGDDEIGARDEEDIEGDMELDEDVLDEYLDAQKAEREELLSLYEPQRGIKDDEPRVIAETRAIIERHYAEDCEDEEATEDPESSDDESKTWDCETVLSTLSNLSNRPGKIGKIKIIKKPPVPLKPVKESEGDEDEETEEEEDVVELPDVITERKKGETAEEKKARKASVKEMRRVCRRMKKESKEMYKNEAAKLPGQTGGADVKQKTRTIKF